MTDSVYKFIEMVGTSPKSWEEAARNAVERAGKSLQDLRVAEVKEMDMKLENDKVTLFSAVVRLSFKYRGEYNKKGAPGRGPCQQRLKKKWGADERKHPPFFSISTSNGTSVPGRSRYLRFLYPFPYRRPSGRLYDLVDSCI